MSEWRGETERENKIRLDRGKNKSRRRQRVTGNRSLGDAQGER